MMTRGLVVAACVLLASAGGSSQPKTDPALTKVAEAFTAAFNAKDAAKVAALYTEDATFMPPNEPMVSGRANIQAWFQKGMDDGFSDLRLMPTESSTRTGLGFEAGTYTIAFKGGTDKGKYVEVFKQVGGQWRIAYDIFNSDLPPPPPAK